MVFSEAVRRVLTTGHTAHLVTLNPDGSPQVSLVWVGLVVNRLKPGSPAPLVKDEFVFLMALVFQAQIKNTLHHIEDLITKGAGDPQGVWHTLGDAGPIFKAW